MGTSICPQCRVGGRVFRSIADVSKYSEDSGTFLVQSIHLILLERTDVDRMGTERKETQKGSEEIEAMVVKV